MGMAEDFKKFILRGNVVELAVGVIIGSAFGKIVSSLVADLIMPPLGILIGGINFTNIKIELKEAVIDSAGKVAEPAVSMNIGNFAQTTLDFLLVASAIFFAIKALERLQSLTKKEADVVVITTAPDAPPPPPQMEVLLAEIRDLLKQKQQA